MNIEGIRETAAMEMAYEINWELFQKGYLTEEDWSNYCHELFDKLLEKNKNILDSIIKAQKR